MDKKYIDDNTIFLTLSGSHAYGTATPESDIDLRGVFINSDKSQYFGFLNNTGQFMDPNEDTVVYELRKIFGLMTDNNPNCLELLYTDPGGHKICLPVWSKVIENRDKFLSKKVRYTYAGYAFSQMKRIRTHRHWLLNPPKGKPNRADYGLKERLITKDQQGAFENILAYLLKDTIEYQNLSEETRKELAEVNFIGITQRNNFTDIKHEIKKVMDVSDNFIEVLSQEKAYDSALRNWQSYENWKATRNPKRKELEAKFGYDTKHSQNLVRLCRQGVEILRDGKLLVKRPDADELLAIRNGAWKFEQVEGFFEQAEKELQRYYETSTLQNKPQRTALDKLCVEVIEEYLYGIK